MKRIHFIKKNKQNSNETKTKPTFEIIKERNITKFNPTVNYFNEYWSIYYENEFILAKIKEAAYEINAMKSHINEISQKAEKECSNNV